MMKNMLNVIRRNRYIYSLFIFLTVMAIAVVAYAGSYVANRRSGIFHYSGCRYVYRMSERNKEYYSDREDCIDDGYRPCKVCRP